MFFSGLSLPKNFALLPQIKFMLRFKLVIVVDMLLDKW